MEVRALAVLTLGFGGHGRVVWFGVVSCELEPGLSEKAIFLLFENCQSSSYRAPRREVGLWPSQWSTALFKTRGVASNENGPFRILNRGSRIYSFRLGYQVLPTCDRVRIFRRGTVL